ncbi:MOP flippase family protein [Halosquirtibacter laminarini]|uniref:MOP flippase family protein n=1 Tax=Halosquirtibacter laminarini TaxID=3374600 RepID=A0AC61NI04_9BACT|nr:MOP flippase family protein [Prolixibacteraceae bacterium]
MLDKREHEVVKGLKWSTINKIITSVFALIQVMVLTRYLDVPVFGQVAIAWVVINFTHVFVDMGITSAVMHKLDATRRQINSLYWLNLLVSLILYGALYGLTPFLSQLYDSPTLIPVIRLLGINLVLITVGRLPQTLLQREFRFKSICLGESLSVILGTIVAIALAIDGKGIYSLVYSTLVKSCVASIIFWWKSREIHKIGWGFSLEEVKELLKIGGYAMGASILDVLSEEADILVLGITLTPHAVGVYSLVKELLSRFFTLINSVVQSVLSPYLSRLQYEPHRLKRTYCMVVHMMAQLNFPLYMGLAFLSREVLTLLYGESFQSGDIVMTFLALAYAIQSISSPVGALQIATGRTDLGFRWTIFRVIITPLVIFLSSFWGAEAVAASFFALCLFMQYPAWRIMIYRMIDLSFIDYIRCYSRSFVIICICLILSFLLNPFIPFESLWGLIVAKGAFIALLFLILTFFVDRRGWRQYMEWGRNFRSLI